MSLSLLLVGREKDKIWPPQKVRDAACSRRMHLSSGAIRRTSGARLPELAPCRFAEASGRGSASRSFSIRRVGTSEIDLQHRRAGRALASARPNCANGACRTTGREIVYALHEARHGDRCHWRNHADDAERYALKEEQGYAQAPRDAPESLARLAKPRFCTLRSGGRPVGAAASGCGRLLTDCSVHVIIAQGPDGPRRRGYDITRPARMDRCTCR